MQYEAICLYRWEDLCVVSILFIISTLLQTTQNTSWLPAVFLFIYIQPTSLSPKWFWKLNNTQRSVNLKVNALLQQFYMGKCHGNNFTSEMVASLNWLVFYFEKLFLVIELASTISRLPVSSWPNMLYISIIYRTWRYFSQILGKIEAMHVFF